MRTDPASLITMLLRSQRLDDAQLIFVLSHYGHSAGKVRATRYRMLKRGEIRFSRMCRVTRRGHVTKQWELSPQWRGSERKEIYGR
jgi:hypothetical protein